MIRVAMMISLALAALCGPARATERDSAVVVMYHRFGDGRFPATNIRLDQFDAHLEELRRGGYHVLPLPEIVDALQAGRPLPDKSVAITIDDAWASVHRHAWPRLKAANLPFTLFVVTDETDRGGPEMMSWDQIREVAASGLATIGTQGAAHPHMAALSKAEVAADLARARARLGEELRGLVPRFFAWPFGEASLEAAEAVREAGFTAAFGQHSGVAWRGDDRFYLPRFAFNQAYGAPDRFRLAARALPLRATAITPADPRLDAAGNPPTFGFTLPAGEGHDALACYASHEGKLAHQRLGPRVEIRPTRPFPAGRGRINCTAPARSPGDGGRWHWFGWQFVVP